MTILAWLLFGLVIGVIAKLLLPGRDPGGFIMTIAIGIVGSLIGGGISYAFFGARNAYEPAGWIMSIVGAILLLLGYRALVRRRAV